MYSYVCISVIDMDTNSQAPYLECNGATVESVHSPSTSYNTVVHLDVEGTSVFYGPVGKPRSVSVTLGDTVASTLGEEETGEESIKQQAMKDGDKTATQKHRQPPPDYVSISIVMSICFPLLGVPFLLFSCLSRSARARGDLSLAWEYSQVALYLFTAEMGVLVLTLMVALVMIWLGDQVAYIYIESMSREDKAETKQRFTQGDRESVETFLEEGQSVQSQIPHLKNGLEWEKMLHGNFTE